MSEEQIRQLRDMAIARIEGNYEPGSGECDGIDHDVTDEEVDSLLENLRNGAVLSKLAIQVICAFVQFDLENYGE